MFNFSHKNDCASSAPDFWHNWVGLNLLEFELHQLHRITAKSGHLIPFLQADNHYNQHIRLSIASYKLMELSLFPFFGILIQ